MHNQFGFKHKRLEVFLTYIMDSFKRHWIKLESCKHKIIMQPTFYSVLYVHY